MKIQGVHKFLKKRTNQRRLADCQSYSFATAHHISLTITLSNLLLPELGQREREECWPRCSSKPLCQILHRFSATRGSRGSPLREQPAKLSWELSSLKNGGSLVRRTDQRRLADCQSYSFAIAHRISLTITLSNLLLPELGQKEGEGCWPICSSMPLCQTSHHFYATRGS
jgi:hypothetical protein